MSFAGHTHSVETRKRIGAASKALWQQPKHAAKVSNALKKLWQQPEYAVRVSSSLKGKTSWCKGLKLPPRSAVWRRRNTHPQTLETRIKIGEAARKRWKSSSYRSKMIAVAKRPKSVEHCKKIAVALAERISKRGFPWPPTNIEYALQLLLEHADFEFEAQKQFGRYVVDMYVPERNIVFEADSAYWHSKRQIRDYRRDKKLLATGIDAVIHLSEKDLDPWTIY